jgi:hypothetical protein
MYSIFLQVRSDTFSRFNCDSDRRSAVVNGERKRFDALIAETMKNLWMIKFFNFQCFSADFRVRLRIWKFAIITNMDGYGYDKKFDGRIRKRYFVSVHMPGLNYFILSVESGSKCRFAVKIFHKNNNTQNHNKFQIQLYIKTQKQTPTDSNSEVNPEFLKFSQDSVC